MQVIFLTVESLWEPSENLQEVTKLFSFRSKDFNFKNNPEMSRDNRLPLKNLSFSIIFGYLKDGRFI